VPNPPFNPRDKQAASSRFEANVNCSGGCQVHHGATPELEEVASTFVKPVALTLHLPSPVDPTIGNPSWPGIPIAYLDYLTSSVIHYDVAVRRPVDGGRLVPSSSVICRSSGRWAVRGVPNILFSPPPITQLAFDLVVDDYVAIFSPLLLVASAIVLTLLPENIDPIRDCSTRGGYARRGGF